MTSLNLHAWLAGDEPSITDFVGRLPEDLHGELLAELIPLDVTYCRKRAEPLDVQDYSGFGPDAVAITQREIDQPSARRRSATDVDLDETVASDADGPQRLASSVDSG